MNSLRRLGDFFLLRIVIPFVSKGHNFVQLYTRQEVYTSKHFRSLAYFTENNFVYACFLCTLMISRIVFWVQCDGHSVTVLQS